MTDLIADLREWLWVREAFHMPREHSRLTLEVTGTKLERLQDISKEDVGAEGCIKDDAGWLPSDEWKGSSGRYFRAQECLWTRSYCRGWWC